MESTTGSSTLLQQQSWTFSVSLDIDTTSSEAKKYGRGFFSSYDGSSANADSCSTRCCFQSQQDLPNVPQHLRQSFREDGFIVFHHPVLSVDVCAALNKQLEEILRGRYDTGMPPDKAPRKFKSEYEGSNYIQTRNAELNPKPKEGEERPKKKPPISVVGPIGFSGNLQNVRVIQVINAQKANNLFRKLARSPVLGKVVADLAGWKDGARLAQDQIWAKPPGAAPLTFHRDSPYFMFDPNPVVTVWIALDDMDAEIGPLQYVRKSHLWGEGRIGTAQQFFQSKGGIALLNSAAQLEGIDTDEMEIISMAGLRAGGLSIHDGRTWHGSGRNESTTRPRRGIGLHYVPVNVKFTNDAKKSIQWKHYLEHVEEASKAVLPLEDFPIPWQPLEIGRQ